MVVGVKSVTLPNVAPAFSSLSIRQTFDMHGFPIKRSLYVVTLYSPTVDIAFAFFSSNSSTSSERPFALASLIRARVISTKSVKALVLTTLHEESPVSKLGGLRSFGRNMVDRVSILKVFLPEPSGPLFLSCNSPRRTQPIWRIHIAIEKIVMDMKAIQDVLIRTKVQ